MTFPPRPTPPPVVEQILALDTRLLVSAERLAQYRAGGERSAISCSTQRHVIDRQLDARLELMAQRDAVRRA